MTNKQIENYKRLRTNNKSYDLWEYNWIQLSTKKWRVKMTHKFKNKLFLSRLLS